MLFTAVKTKQALRSFVIIGTTLLLALGQTSAAEGNVSSLSSTESVVNETYRFLQTVQTPFVIAEPLFDFSEYQTFKIYVETMNSDDFVHRVYGDALHNASFAAPSGIYNNNFCLGATSGQAPSADFFYGGYNAHTFDSWVGIGLTSFPNTVGGEVDVTLQETSGLSWSDNFSLEFMTSGNYGPVDFSLDDADTACGWALDDLNATNGFTGDDFRAIVMQVTSPATIVWTLNAEIYVHGDPSNVVLISQTFDGTSLGPVLIEGCTDANACNYYDLATVDNGSCVLPQELYDCDDVCLNDLDGDSICDELEIPGCQDVMACNYMASATDENNTCVYPTGCETCSGEMDGSGSIIDNDSDDDGVCNLDEIVGCQDDEACNYDSDATDPANCIYRDAFSICDGDGSIQNAIENASPADTIHVPAGTYAEALVINKSIILIANGEVILDVSGNMTGISVLENVSLVIIQGLNIIGNDLTGSGITLNPGTSNISIRDNSISNILLPGGGNLSPLSYGILCWGNSSPVNPPTDILIENNEINGVLGSAVSLGANTESIIVRDNRFENIQPVAFAGSYLAVGIHAELANNLSISNNEFVDLLQSNNLVNCTDVAISNNTYDSSSLLLLTTFPHEISFSDAPWWSTTLSLDGQSLSEAFVNTPLDSTYLYFSALEGFSQSSSNPGCNDVLACNYDLNALSNDGSCIYSDGVCESCSGETNGTGSIVDNDSDNDGVCDDDELLGCQDVLACNYDIAATDAGACIYIDENCESCSGETDGTGSIVDNDSDDDGVCDDDELLGCQDALACNYNNAATDAGDCVFVDGVCETCSGETDGTGTPVDNDSDDDGVCNADEIAGCQEALACNYNSAATDAGDCVFVDGVCETCSGEIDGTGTPVDNDSDEDGVCNADEIVGCQDALACNYNSAATDVGDCVFADDVCETCSGETDGTGTPVDNDSDDDGICDANEIQGCQDVEACNFMSNATDGGVECAFATGPCDVCIGSDTDGTGTILDLDEDDDLVCDADEISGCQDLLACNFMASATDAADCVYPIGCATCSGESDGTGFIVSNDDDGDGVCNADEVVGCIAPAACNFNTAATDVGSCEFAQGCETCSGATDGTGTIVDNDSDGDGICNADEIAGCLNELACNYVANATDPGACYVAGMYFDCSGDCLNDEDGNGICDEIDLLINDAEYEGFLNGFDFGVETCEGAEFCGEGTVWSEDFQLCVEASSCPGDLNDDLVVGTGDLLLLLVDYGFYCNE